MSLKLRLKYHYRSMWQMLAEFSLPAWVLGQFMKVTVISLAVAFGVGYLFQVNAISTSGYVIHDLELKVAGLQNDQKRLSSEVASYQSLARINSRLHEVAMVPSGPIAYAKLYSDVAVAQR